jgi:hypothetical protein
MKRKRNRISYLWNNYLKKHPNISYNEYKKIYKKNWIKKNKLRKLQYNRKYNNIHKEQKNANYRKYYKKNKQRIQQYHKKWRKNNKKHLNNYNKKYQMINKHHFKELNLKRNYGINYTMFQNLLIKQNNKCLICNEPFNNNRKPCVDHNHITKQIRGILCNTCNIGLGALKIDIKPDNLKNALKYIRRNK